MGTGRFVCQLLCHDGGGGVPERNPRTCRL